MKYAIVHLADIHYKCKEPEGALAIITAFIDDLQQQMRALVGYRIYLAITGDIVSSGSDEESYMDFLKKVGKQLDDIGLSKDTRMVVPGNHDVDRKMVGINIVKFKKELNEKSGKETDFNNFVCDDEYYKDKFNNYWLFEDDFAKYGIDFNFGGKGWIIDNELGVYCLNSAICSFGGLEGIDDRNNLAIETRGLVGWCSSVNVENKILLMHHPIDYLVKWSKNELKQLVENKFLLCLCGHNHEQNIFYTNLSNKCLVCAAPQLFTDKQDLLGYAIIQIENNMVDKIIYRQYVKDRFLNGSGFSGNDGGIINPPNEYRNHIEILEDRLNSSLAFFKGTPPIFIEPKISTERNFNQEPNLLHQLIRNPKSVIIISQPQFGATCLSHYMVLQAYRDGGYWVYLDAKYIKARQIENEIKLQLKSFNKQVSDIKCIILDSWEISKIDHRNIIKHICKEYDDVPIVVMSNYYEYRYNENFSFSGINREFELLHLQAMERNKIRALVSSYSLQKKIENEELVISRVVKDLEALNIHRTPLNCLTILKAFEGSFNEDLVNRTKLIKTVLFILFTSADSFTYSSKKPDVDECQYVIGKFCKSLIERQTRRFTRLEFQSALKNTCDEELMFINIDVVIDILESNNILLHYNGFYEFKHSYWIFYFAATYMLHDVAFANYIFKDKRYANCTEIIEFYTGLDGRRDDAMSILLNDLKDLNKTVKEKIGISGDFNPFDCILWNPSTDNIESIRKEISKEVHHSKLPTNIKDQHADKNYDSEAPYNQSINKFLNEYSVTSLFQSIKASSKALRNSTFVHINIRKEMIEQIIDGWEQISNIIFWLSPVLAKSGRASYDGLSVVLFGKFDEIPERRLKQIFISNPNNVVCYFKDNLSSNKVGPLIFNLLKNTKSNKQKHFLSMLLIKERPPGWFEIVFKHMNMLHRSSYYLCDLKDAISYEIEHSFLSENDLSNLKNLLSIVIAKHKNAPKKKIFEISDNMIYNKDNRLPIDKIFSQKK